MSVQEMSHFSYLFTRSLQASVRDCHLWFSVVFRPYHSTFTRCQRLSSCFAALFLTMIVSAMFYEQDISVKHTNMFVLGPLKISLYELWVSLVSILIIMPPLTLIVQIFRRVRPSEYMKTILDSSRIIWWSHDAVPGNNEEPQIDLCNSKCKDKISQCTDNYHSNNKIHQLTTDHLATNEMHTGRLATNELDQDIKEIFGSGILEGYGLYVVNEKQMGSVKDGVNNSVKSKQCLNQHDIGLVSVAHTFTTPHQNGSNTLSTRTIGVHILQQNTNQTHTMKPAMGDLRRDITEGDAAGLVAKKGWPRWTLLVGWVLVQLAIIIPAFFIMLYSMQWGRQRSEAWLVSFLLSFIETLFIVDPIKVILVLYSGTPSYLNGTK